MRQAQWHLMDKQSEDVLSCGCTSWRRLGQPFHYRAFGKALFGAVVNYENDNIFYDPPVAVANSAIDAAAIIDSIEGATLTLDGVARPDLVSRVKSPVFEYVLPAETISTNSLELTSAAPFAQRYQTGIGSTSQPRPRDPYPALRSNIGCDNIGLEATTIQVVRNLLHTPGHDLVCFSTWIHLCGSSSGWT